MKYWTFLVLICISLRHLPVEARQDIVPGSKYTSGRGAALGDAFLPLAEDGASALFYNPAAVGKFRNPQVEPLNLGIYANANYVSTINRNFYKVTSLSSYSPTLSLHTDQWMGAGLSLLPNYYMKGFAFGLLAQSQVVGVQNRDGSITYKSLYQLVPAAATGVRLAGGIVRLGYSFQWVNQAVGTVNAQATDSPLGWNQRLAQGNAFSHNLGFALTLPYAYLPALNIVARNLFSARYRSGGLPLMTQNSSGLPANEPMTIDTTFSLQPKTGRGSWVNMVFALRDATNRSQISILGRAAIGLEFAFRDKLFLRGGWGSGYPSAGFGLKNKKGEFSLTWHSEEIGSSYHSIKDTRYFIHYQLRVF